MFLRLIRFIWDSILCLLQNTSLINESNGVIKYKESFMMNSRVYICIVFGSLIDSQRIIGKMRKWAKSPDR
jgi:hypothetical protein